MITVEQIVNVQKSNVETLFGLIGAAFEGIEAGRAESASRQVGDRRCRREHQGRLSVKGREVAGPPMSLLQPAAEKPLRTAACLRSPRPAPKCRASPPTSAEAKPSSWRSSTRPSRTRLPASAVALVKSAVAAANNAFESMQKASKQAAEVANTNFQAMSSTAVRATKTKRAA
jgi:hypothetical protein